MQQIITIENGEAALSTDLYGGAITDFHLHRNSVNPLSAKFTKEQMPDNNKAGAVYQGHFICLGRWGLPSAGEMEAGLPNHGQPANMQWKLRNRDSLSFQIEAHAAMEGLQVARTSTLDPQSSAYHVTETVTNTAQLGRLYNMVQHPMLTPPFLDAATVVDCNGVHGFNQAYTSLQAQPFSQWPTGMCEDGRMIDLRQPTAAHNGVFSFVVNESDPTGWITAFSPTHQLLLGYVWKRSDYPWIHCWQHWMNGVLQYRGIEFGTAGIHKPFNEILDDAPVLLGEKTYRYIDAGEKQTRGWISFIMATGDDFTGTQSIAFKNNNICITPYNGMPELILPVNFSL